ncbi:hypothetical protein ACFQGE_00405 [Halomicroarcula sp. GCM10025817]|uniref:hypothetical protein n=1 Tax=Haloarcula TaxID=2237 RepID=UPI0023E7DC74|nr:hypothetical protein [Halomicroarcula sp. SYNS111]
MKTEHALLGVVALLLLGGLATAAVGAAVLTDFGQEAAFEETSIRSVDMTDPYCSDPRTSNSSSRSRPVPGGRVLTINDTIAVDAPDSTVSVHLDGFGPGRYVLAFDREPGEETADCHLEVRYNVSLNLSQPQDYTLLVTHDDRLVGGYYGDENSGGGFGVSSASAAGGSASGGASSGSAGGSDSAGDADEATAAPDGTPMTEDGAAG